MEDLQETDKEIIKMNAEEVRKDVKFWSLVMTKLQKKPRFLKFP